MLENNSLLQSILLLLTGATEDKEDVVIPILGAQKDNLGTGINWIFGLIMLEEELLPGEFPSRNTWRNMVE